MAGIRLRSDADLRQLLVSVIDDTQVASFHRRLHKRLRGSIRRWVRELNEAPAFWSLTLTAHVDAALFRLIRLYDSHPAALSLPRLLETIEAHVHMFDEPAFRRRLSGNPFVDNLAKDARRPPSARLRRDLRYVRASDPHVAKLLALRNRVLAHRDPRVVLAGGSKPAPNLSLAHLDLLLRRSARITNRYSILFEASSHMMRIVGEDDYLSVLKSVRAQRAARDRQFREELGQLRRGRRTRG